MNIHRAKEISTSPIMADVKYQGTPIYIQAVNDENKTARIFPLDEPENEQTVPLSGLIENEN
ncbi:H-type small acid-soluble spore protein [Terrilactibacillus sp. BCM23-1]|uniref:Small, acid-soluble spore protein H n=1 Tax=Terrilactibacillus tamarindi TaxID=2599694 RepID=A0A6N8CTF7_9BACI|nr:H-type small acid-soluble spore protein [Terrilactibacillus tamarindi]MTT32948.1 H-type small acid-soluble spore protein [Terrilactibacillus tamarindi]